MPAILFSKERENIHHLIVLSSNDSASYNFSILVQSSVCTSASQIILSDKLNRKGVT